MWGWAIPQTYCNWRLFLALVSENMTCLRLFRCLTGKLIRKHVIFSETRAKNTHQLQYVWEDRYVVWVISQNVLQLVGIFSSGFRKRDVFTIVFVFNRQIDSEMRHVSRDQSQKHPPIAIRFFQARIFFYNRKKNSETQYVFLSPRHA